MKRLAAATLAALALASPAAAQGPSLAELIKQLSVKWNKPTEPFRMIGNIHYVGTDGLAVYLITTPAGHILIDTAMPEANPQIKSSIEKLGFKVADIKVMINTHAHIDHTGGLADFKKVTGAQMIAGEADKPLLEGGYYPGRENAEELKFQPLKVDRTIKAGDKVTVGDVTLIAHETPGHSPGCTSFAMSVKDGEAMRSVIFFLQRNGGAEPDRRQADAPDDRGGLSQDLCVGQDAEVRYSPRAASRDVRDAGEARENGGRRAQSLRRRLALQRLPSNT